MAASAASAANAAAAAAASSSSSDDFDPGAAAAAAAYRAGVALALSERLRAASGVFDRARAARYAAAASDREGREAALRRAAARASPAKAAAAAGAAAMPFDFASSSAAASPSSSSPSQQQQMQMQMQMQATTKNSAAALLLAEISAQREDVARAEATARELAALNRAFAGAVATQAEAIEALYESALVSVANVKRGNAQLRKANAAGAGARRWVFISLLVAALGILLADWLSS